MVAGDRLMVIESESNHILYRGACNAHMHIIDPTYLKKNTSLQKIGTITQWKVISKQLGLERAVFVQAKPFCHDNTCIIDAIKSFGKDNSVGIGVVKKDVTQNEIINLDDNGIKGVRFSIWNPNNAVTSCEDIPVIAEKIKSFGWHIQLHMSVEQIIKNFNKLKNLNLNLVIDHMGRIGSCKELTGEGFKVICRLIDKGNTWIKLSGAYLNSQTTYPWKDVDRVAKAFIEYAPDRMVWGSDWPHVTEDTIYDESIFIEQLYRWCNYNLDLLELILVKNPCDIYGFKRLSD